MQHKMQHEKKETLISQGFQSGSGGIRTHGRFDPSTDFEGRETAKTPYISAQSRINCSQKACKNGLFSYLVICVHNSMQHCFF